MLHHEKHEIYRIENLTKAYGSGSAYTEVIKGINLSISAGEYLVVLGPSGSGKSTFLYLLAGLENPTRGRILVRGRDISQFNSKQIAHFHRTYIGIVYQSFHLLTSFTILENVAFPLVLHGLRRKKREERAMEVLQRFGIDALYDHLPSQISGGQQQKAAIARAMINMPPILLIDEPTGNLDSESAQEVMDLIDKLHKIGGRTIVLVTHNADFTKYATRTVYIVDGKLYENEADIPIRRTNLQEEAEMIEEMRELTQDQTLTPEEIETMINPFEKSIGV